MRKLLKLIFSTALIIFNHIIFANCFSGGFGYNSFFIGNKLYYTGIIEFFDVDLTNISLDTDALVEESKWIDLTKIKPRPDGPNNSPILGGKANDKIMYLEKYGDNLYVHSFDATLNQWTIGQEVIVSQQLPFISRNWVTDKKTGIAYSLDSITDSVSVFDTVNLKYSVGPFVGNLGSYDDFVQVVLPNSQILFIGGTIGGLEQPMNSILTYDAIKSTWLTTKTAGKAPGGRTKHTVVSTPDGRVIVFGGLSKRAPASPHLSTLDTSKIPYEWSTPIIENSIGCFSDHTAVMANNNYMISSFGRNESETNPIGDINSEDIYKLNVADPLKYKWSLLAKFNYPDSPTNATPTYDGSSNPIQTEVTVDFNSTHKGLKPYWVVTIMFILVVLICISIFVLYKAKQYRCKNKDAAYRQNTSNDEFDELEKNST